MASWPPVTGAFLISNSICRGNEIEWRDPSGSGAESSINTKLEFHFGFRLAFHAPAAQAAHIYPDGRIKSKLAGSRAIVIR